MLLAIDIGNTNITIGLFDGDEIEGTFRMTTKMPRTSDEYGIFFYNILHSRGLHREQVDAAIIASVVPDVNHHIINGLIKYFNVTPIVVGPGIKTGIKIAIPNPKEVGADRIVDAVAAYEIYGGPVLVIDYGTATTHDLVLEDASLVGGVTSPGIRIAAHALWQDLRSCRRLRSNVQIPYWAEIRYLLCSPVLCMDISVRRNTLSGRFSRRLVLRR